MITGTQQEKTGSIGKIFIPVEIVNFNSFRRNRLRFCAPFPRSQFEMHNLLFTSLSADEFQLNSKSVNANL